MKYIFTPTAEDQFDKLTSLQRRRISVKMRFYAAQSDPRKFAEALTGSNEYRFRITAVRFSDCDFVKWRCNMGVSWAFFFGVDLNTVWGSGGSLPALVIS